MLISLFSSVGNTEAQQVQLSWSELVAELSEFQDGFPKKASVPLWSPAAIPTGQHRNDNNVQEVSALVLDLDLNSEAEAFGALDKVRKFTCVVHTTWSHNPDEDKWRMRAVMQLSRTVQPEEWKYFWQRAVATIGIPIKTKRVGGVDPQCSAISNQYYVPARPTPNSPSFALSYQGDMLDVNSILTIELPTPLLTAYDLEKEPSLQLSKEMFTNFVKLLLKKKDPFLQELADRFNRVLKGERFAEHGERDDILFRMAIILGERFPRHTPESIAVFFRASLSHMRHEPEAPTEKDVIYKVRRAQATVREKKAKSVQEQQHAKFKRVQEAFRNGRTTPYQPEEFPPSGHWILQQGGSYYIWLDGTYEGPYVAREARNAAERDLAPAYNVIDLYSITEKGSLVPKPIDKLVSEYGTVIHTVLEDLHAQSSTYDSDARTLTRAVCPLRDLEPVYNEDVAKWFEIIGGDRYEDFLTWIAALTRLDLPCAALFITGPPGAGKSLLAGSLARLWTTDKYTTMDEALSQFNDALLRCPLVFADETLPKDFRGYTKNAELRHFIQATRRTLNRKFIPATTIHGAVRVIVAANNEEVLATAENLSVDDIAAIAQRYFHRPLTGESASFLADVQPRTNRWLEDDIVAKHALWVRDNHKWEATERFIIPPSDSYLHISLTVRSGARSAVCQWICGFLLDPARFKHDGRSGHLATVDALGRVLINARALERCWKLYVLNEECPPTGKLAAAIATISKGRVQRRALNAWKERTWYREIELDSIFAWIDRTGYADREHIQEAIQKLAKEAEKELLEATN